MSVHYLEAKDVIKMNVIQIKKYSPNEPIGVKDANALEMCVGQLRASAFGEEVYPSIYEKAAILLIQLIKKHPFHNANKRTAFLATFVFLKINGQLLAIDQKDWNGNSFFDKFYKVQNFFPYAIPIVLDNEPPRM